MREIRSHRSNPVNEQLIVFATDEPGAGGAQHRYEVFGINASGNPSAGHARSPLVLLFQNGPMGVVGPNGVTHEVLLAIVADRLASFQKGPYACRENAVALTKIEEALMWLDKRTNGRIERGVEGTHEV